jgi:predicted N-acetyltransferase YhbS
MVPESTNVTVRPARPDDLPGLADIERDADRRFTAVGHAELADGDTVPAAVTAAAHSRGDLLVAEDEGVVVGWLLLVRLGDDLCIGQVSVSPTHGRRGIGTALLRAAIAEAVARGESGLVLNTQGDVAWNRPWYERHGFTVVSAAEWTVAMVEMRERQISAGLDWATRVHMRLPLARPDRGVRP